MDNTRITKIPVTLVLDLHKLQYYGVNGVNGVNGVSLILITSYLNETYKYIKYDHFDSTLLDITIIIYINDLINSSN